MNKIFVQNVLDKIKFKEYYLFVNAKMGIIKILIIFANVKYYL